MFPPNVFICFYFSGNSAKIVDTAENPLYNVNIVQLSTNFYKEDKVEEKKGNVGWAVLGGFLPFVGLILWLVWKDTKPEDAKMAGKGALIGAIVEVSISVLTFLMGSCMMMTNMSAFGDMGGLFSDVMDEMMNNM